MLRYVLKIEHSMAMSAVIGSIAAIAIVVFGAPPVTMLLAIVLVWTIAIIGQSMEAREHRHR